MEKKILTVIVTILTTGLILDTIYKRYPDPVQGNESSSFEADYQEDIEYINNTDIKETILEEGLSTSIYDKEYEGMVNNIRIFLEKRKSPLAKYANDFVDASLEYNIDYRLVASISIVESSGGINNFRRYNAWGWGKINFESWEDGIWTVSRGLAKYYAKGLDTPEKISTYYCPPHASKWAKSVNTLIDQIEG
jgi:hypothetical protein